MPFSGVEPDFSGTVCSKRKGFLGSWQGTGRRGRALPRLLLSPKKGPEPFCCSFCPDVRKRRPEVPRREVPGFLGYYDGDEFRVAVAVSLPALLYVRLSPREAPLCLPALPWPRAEPRPCTWGGGGRTRSPPLSASHFLPDTRLRRGLPRALSLPVILHPTPFTRQVAAERGHSAEAAGRVVLAGPVLLPPAQTGQHDGDGSPGEPALQQREAAAYPPSASSTAPTPARPHLPTCPDSTDTHPSPTGVRSLSTLAVGKSE